MADIFLNADDSRLVKELTSFGLKYDGAPQYWIIRLALTKSLSIKTPPDQSFDSHRTGGNQFHLRQVTGYGAAPDDNGNEHDFDLAIRAILSSYHGEDLFSDNKKYKNYLNRHICRGLSEFRSGWSRSHDFYGYLYQELVEPVANEKQIGGDNSSSRLEQLKEALHELGVSASIKEVLRGARLERFLLYLNDVSQYDILKRGVDKLSFQMGLKNSAPVLSHTSERKVVSLDIPLPKNEQRSISPAPLEQWVGNSGFKIPIWLGQTVSGEDFGFDLAEAPHLLVAGTTGSGKSVCIHSIILSLLSGNSPDKLKLALIDPKQVEFAPYSGIPQLYGSKVVSFIDDADSLLSNLVEEMEERNRLLADVNESNLDVALVNGSLDLPRIVVIVEELADLLMQSKDLEGYLVRLAQKARSVGIHLVLATQRPDSAILTGLLRSNIPSRICLLVQKSTESKIVIDETGSEKLLGKGDMLIKMSGDHELHRVHGAMITEADRTRIIGQIR